MAPVPPERRPSTRRRRAEASYPDAPYVAGPYGAGPYVDGPAPLPDGRPWDDGTRPSAPPEPEPRRRWRRDRADRARRGRARRIGRLLAVVAVVQALVLLALRWVDPPTTAFMLANPDGAVQQSVPIEHVSRNFLAAVIAHEDQQLPYRSGAFTWDELSARATAHLAGDEDPSGSTIPQQVAKNLFLNQEMSAWRKAVEAGLAAELALVVDDRRMLELYVNYAQFGPTIYGVCAASWYYFDSPPQDLPVASAVQLVGLLPSPGHVRRAPGGGLDFEVEDGMGWLSESHVLNAQARVPRHIEARGFQPVEDVGVAGLAADQPAADDDCSRRPQAVADLIAAEGNA